MRELDDLSLIELAQQENHEAENILLLRYNACIDSIASSLNPSTNDKEDLNQEGRLALVRAIKTFQTNRNANFKTYASHCIKNAMLDHLKKDCSKSSKLIFETDLEPYHKEHIDNLVTKDPTPEEHLIQEEADKTFYDDLKVVLNDDEVSVINLYLSAMSYREISESLGMPIKRVDNTLTAAKRKLKKLLEKIK